MKYTYYIYYIYIYRTRNEIEVKMTSYCLLQIYKIKIRLN